MRHAATGQLRHSRARMNDMAFNGILNVNKPPAWTSRDVVNRVDRLCSPSKAGHAGTLDPLATGVLVICVGQATRLIEYVQRMRKRYRATFLLGRSSDTDDTEGDITVNADAPMPSRMDIDDSLQRFVGSISQRPPAHSAIKVQGRPAYRLARQGVAVELAPRVVEVHSLRVLRYDYPALDLDIECGSGTYVRALGRDLAAELGTTAVMSALERTAVGAFRVADAVALDELSAETVAKHLKPPITAVTELPRVELDDAKLNEIRHGRSISLSGSAGAASPEWAAVTATGELAAILREKRPGELWPRRNLA
jgi:tRNA pseudouridine55 synthase